MRNADEAAAVGGLEVWLARDLKEVIEVARGAREPRLADRSARLLHEPHRSRGVIDLADVRGQAGARRDAAADDS